MRRVAVALSQLCGHGGGDSDALPEEGRARIHRKGYRLKNMSLLQ